MNIGGSHSFDNVLDDIYEHEIHNCQIFIPAGNINSYMHSPVRYFISETPTPLTVLRTTSPYTGISSTHCLEL